jgi:uncharacterized phage-associated protein
MAKAYRAIDVARYFLAKTDADVGDLISNLKLQKLCYYAQGVGLVARNEPMFGEEIQAWLHGPVVPVLWRHFREFGSAALPPVDDLELDAYTPADRRVLDDVYEYYGQYSAWRLREMTHGEAPWADAYGQGGPNTTIDLDSLHRFFSTQVAETYAKRYEQISRGEA